MSEALAQASGPRTEADAGPVACIPVPKEHVHAVWSAAAPMLDRALATVPGTMTLDDLLLGLQTDEYMLWVVFIDKTLVAAFTTRIVEYPRRRALSIDWVGGSRMREWFSPVMEVIRRHARYNGCRHVEGYGRDAWFRWVSREGFVRGPVVFRMELSDGRG